MGRRTSTAKAQTPACGFIATQQDDVVTYNQVKEFVSNAGRRVPGLKSLKIEVAEDGTVSFEFEVFRIIGGKGKV